MPDENASPPPPPRKGCCLWRLIAIALWLTVGFGLGWSVREAEEQAWDGAKTWDALQTRARLLAAQVGSLFPEADATPPPAAPADDGPPPGPDEIEPPKPPETSEPAKPREPEKAPETSPADGLLKKGDAAFDAGKEYLAQAVSTASAKDSNRYYGLGEKKFELALEYYEQAQKLEPDNRRLARKIQKAGTHLYTCKKHKRNEVR